MFSCKYRALDASGDMVFGRGAAAFLTGAQAVRQALETRLRLFCGEWWESPDEGLPLFQQMLGRPQTQAQKELMDLLVTERIADTRKVTRVYDAQSALDGRTYRFTCNVQTEFGETTVEVTY